MRILYTLLNAHMGHTRPDDYDTLTLITAVFCFRAFATLVDFQNMSVLPVGNLYRVGKPFGFVCRVRYPQVVRDQEDTTLNLARHRSFRLIIL